MTKENKHTQWSVFDENEHHGFYVEDENGNTICDLYFMDNVGKYHHPYNDGGEAKDNAEFIVKSCNSHYELLEALEMVTKASQAVLPPIILRKAKQALKKARGES